MKLKQQLIVLFIGMAICVALHGQIPLSSSNQTEKETVYYLFYLEQSYSELELQQIANNSYTSRYSLDFETPFNTELTVPLTRNNPIGPFMMQQTDGRIRLKVKSRGLADSELFVDVPATYSQALIFILQNEGSFISKVFGVTPPLSDDPSYAVINASKDMAAIILNQQKTIIPSMQSARLPINVEASEAIVAEFYINQDNQPRRIRRIAEKYREARQYTAILTPAARDKPDQTVAHIQSENIKNYKRSAALSASAIKQRELDGLPETTKLTAGELAIPLQLIQLCMDDQKARLLHDGREMIATESSGRSAFYTLSKKSGTIEIISQGSKKQSIAVNSTWGKYLLALSYSEINQPPTIHAFENSEQSHPSGHYRLFNLSPYQLGYAIDQSVKYLSPMESALLPRSDDRRIQLSLALKTPSGWKSIAKEEPPVLDANQRVGLFISDTEGNGDFSLNSIEL